jgi:hypothetical protein
VKYDVRKNFADSRIRVKGRFVKKEDQAAMLLSMGLEREELQRLADSSQDADSSRDCDIEEDIGGSNSSFVEPFIEGGEGDLDN